MELLRNSMFSTTSSSHGKHWAEWLRFVSDGANLNRLACSQAMVAFIADMCVLGLLVSLTRIKLAGVAFMLKLLGKEDVILDFLVKQLMKGWSKNSVEKDMRRPVSFLILQRLL